MHLLLDATINYFLKNTTKNDKKFKEFLDKLVDETINDLKKYSEDVNSYTDSVIKKADSSGLPYELAVHLTKEPYVVHFLGNYNIKQIVKNRIKENISI